MENIIVKNGAVHYGGQEYKCAIGPNGVGQDKKEGDGKTPVGVFPLRRVFYRADRIQSLPTNLPLVVLSLDDAWCDDVNDLEHYNKHIKLPYVGSHENLWREDDHLYDIIVEVGYNDDPPVPGKGSAIFMHIARPAFTPTGGCVALTQEDLMALLSQISPDTQIEIQENS